jgi:DNA-binding transcriptional regulator YdaS (Cro superfamily)
MACTKPLDSNLHVMHKRGMKLSDYMAREGLTDTALALKLGVASSTVLRWRSEKTKPDWRVLPAITAATDGQVTANDFIQSAPRAGAHTHARG